MSPFSIRRLEEVPECDRHFSFSLSAIGETTQSFLLWERPPDSVLWVADTIQQTQKEFCISEAEEEKENRQSGEWIVGVRWRGTERAEAF